MAFFADIGLGLSFDASRVEAEVRTAVAGRAAELRNERVEAWTHNLAVSIANEVGRVLQDMLG